MTTPTPRGERVILGIDPGTSLMGYAALRAEGRRAEALAMGVIDLRRVGDPYLRLGRIYERVTGIIEAYLPDEMAIESPFIGKNAQSALKLGRAQGVAVAAAISRQVPVAEYAPSRIKMAVTGSGAASKDQVADMLRRILRLESEEMGRLRDASDALGAAYCHFLESGAPQGGGKCASWKEYARKKGII